MIQVKGKYIWSTLLLGLCVMIAGFIYEMLYAGIPVQDPTPQQTADYFANQSISFSVMSIGALLFVLGILLAILKLFQRKKT